MLLGCVYVGEAKRPRRKHAPHTSTETTPDIADSIAPQPATQFSEHTEVRATPRVGPNSGPENKEVTVDAFTSIAHGFDRSGCFALAGQ